jgi:hypothetical protein
MTCRGATRQLGYFMDLLQPQPERGGLHWMERAVTTYTTSTLMSDTLSSRAQPPPSGWTDITLEQTYEYQNCCRGTRFTLLIMQGIRYKYKQMIAYMSDATVYKLCKYINLEDNSIKDIQELQRRRRDKPIPNTPMQPRESEQSYFSVISTNLWTKQERNMR